ncbi:MAG: hypothetical protein R2838_18730 [Caldilineaceae bacterium]
MIAAVAAADEAATASLAWPVTPTSRRSWPRVWPPGCAAGPPLLVYCAENTPQAADILAEHVRRALPLETPPSPMDDACFVDTVIAKMSGLAPAADGLAPIAGRSGRLPGGSVQPHPHRPPLPGRRQAQPLHAAFLSSPRSRTSSRLRRPSCTATTRATPRSYLAQVAGLTTMDQLTTRPDLRALVRQAMVDEAVHWCTVTPAWIPLSPLRPWRPTPTT